MNSKALLYLHGFLSSPLSYKAQVTKKWLHLNRPDLNYVCPILSSYPGQAIETIRQIMGDFKQRDINPIVVGSSLGGYWSTWLSDEYGVRSVVINPAISPSMFKPDYLGVELESYHSDDIYILTKKDVDDLKSVFVESIQDKKKIWLMAQTADETCDYRLAVEKYKGCRQLVEEGGDHSFQGYEKWLPEIIQFLEEPF